MRPLRSSAGGPSAALAVVAMVLVAACGSTSSRSTDRVATNLEAQVPMAATQPGVDYADVAAGTRQLGYQMTRSVPDEDGNVVVSPASLAIAFAMVREGATGAAAEEIDAAFGFPPERQAAYNGLLHELADPGAGSVLESANGAFVEHGYPINRGYLAAIKRWYGAGLVQTDFPQQAVPVINGWVDRRTHGRIPKLLDGLDPDTVFTLVNTLYLNAKWQHPFDPDLITDGSFTTGDGRSVSVDMMQQAGELDYGYGDGWQAIRLPYRGGELSMMVLLPDKGRDPAALLSPDNLVTVEAALAPTYVEMSMPRWDTGTNASLQPMLEQLGLSQAFRPGALGGITPDPKFFLSDVVQEANLTVGEKGTEGAAATAVIFEESAGNTAPKMYVDSPFAFVVMHEPTGVPVFEGVVVDPS